MERITEVGFDKEKRRISSLLKSHGIDLEKWGVGGAKTVDHLVNELILGESHLVQTLDGEIFRVLETAAGIVEYIDPDGNKLLLVEDRQEFKDGRIRQRGYTKWSISEKQKPAETSCEAMERAIKEELGLINGYDFDEFETIKEIDESHSFPGLNTEYTIHGFLVHILPESYKPEYIEEQEDKITYFAWKNA
jgi:8-oxo-dGTP pyrophosphatase MutT (NUDIX family)